jgi:hypothetical protein
MVLESVNPTALRIASAAFLSMAARSTVDKTLTRMVLAGQLSRPSRGIFVRPQMSRFGALPPEPFEVAVAKAHGAPVQVHGAEAARRFGLSTQVPAVFCTTGRSRTFTVGNTEVRLQQISPRKLVAPGTKVGMAISALWYLGKEQVNHEVLNAIHSQLSEQEWIELKAAAPQMPSWMADGLHRYDKGAH